MGYRITLTQSNLTLEPYYELDSTAQNVERQVLDRGLNKGEFGIKLFIDLQKNPDNSIVLAIN